MGEKSRLPLLLLLAAICLLATDGNAAHAQSKAQQIDALLTRYHTYGRFNGAVLVAESGRVIYEKGFGFANFEWKIPNTPDTRFRIGSVTKSFTAMLVFQLAEQGKLRLDGKVTDYLPDFPRKTGDQITIKHLLTHTSGLPDYNSIPEFFRAVQGGLLSPDEIVKRISQHELGFEPGTRFGYSNDGYVLLGEIVRRVTGKPYEQVLRENIIEPLNLKDTGYSHQNTILERRASGYRKTSAGIENAPYYLESPAGGIYSTAKDLFLLEQALYDDKLLSRKHKDLMWEMSSYGNAYGWSVSKTPRELTGDDTLQMIRSDGAVFGFFSRVVRLPRDRHTIILLSNVRAATNYLPEIEQRLISIIYNKPYKLPKPSIADALLITITQKGVEAALGQYSDLKNSKSDLYDFSEAELNYLGYTLLNRQKIREAIEIFKLNVEAYPQSSNVYDSLGEAYMKNGDKELAIRNYQKSVELNPRNANGIEILRRLTERQ